jgi:murein L,D-transpeptidase YafK
MNCLLSKCKLITLVAVTAALSSFAQNAYVASNRTFIKSSEVSDRVEDSLKKQFEEKKLSWPPQSIYIRSFKYDRVLEVWARNDNKEAFTLFKTYKVCMQSGTMGPKRIEGDYQVPEGFYYINEFNPNSKYHLSLGLNYPNTSDRILSDSDRPGGSIYIHGNCVSVGCIALNDASIEELYTLTNRTKLGGQDFIPVHVFPVKYNIRKSIEFLAESTIGNPAVQKFAIKLKEAFDFFEEKKQLPVIMVNRTGDYIIN